MFLASCDRTKKQKFYENALNERLVIKNEAVLSLYCQRLQ